MQLAARLSQDITVAGRGAGAGRVLGCHKIPMLLAEVLVLLAAMLSQDTTVADRGAGAAGCQAGQAAAAGGPGAGRSHPS